MIVFQAPPLASGFSKVKAENSGLDTGVLSLQLEVNKASMTEKKMKICSGFTFIAVRKYKPFGDKNRARKSTINNRFNTLIESGKSIVRNTTFS